MGECPFCGSQVTDDLITYGGTCPKCFAEIPGEEAATDPGVDVREAQERRDRRRALLRRVLGFSFVLMVVSCTGVVALVLVAWPEPQVAEILDFDDLDYQMPDIVSGEEPTAAPRPQSRPRPGPSPAPVASTDRGVRTELNPISPELGGAGGLSQPAGINDLSLSAPAVRRDDNVVLSDANAIRDMIGERMVEFIPGLNQCYERRLKRKPSLQGRWRLAFTVQPSGSVTNVSVTALSRSDSEFESCLSSHIRNHWRFGKITLAQPIQKTLRFSY